MFDQVNVLRRLDRAPPHLTWVEKGNNSVKEWANLDSTKPWFDMQGNIFLEWKNAESLIQCFQCLLNLNYNVCFAEWENLNYMKSWFNVLCSFVNIRTLIKWNTLRSDTLTWWNVELMKHGVFRSRKSPKSPGFTLNLCQGPGIFWSKLVGTLKIEPLQSPENDRYHW